MPVDLDHAVTASPPTDRTARDALPELPLAHRPPRPIRWAAAIAALVVGVVAIVGAWPETSDDARVVSEETGAVVVPLPKPRPQLVPRKVPHGFRLRSWTEAVGAGGWSYPLDLFAAGSSPTDRPWVRVSSMPAAPTDRTPTERLEERRPGGRLHLVRRVDTPDDRIVATVVGRGVSDADLRRVAAGLRSDGTGVDASWLPRGVHRARPTSRSVSSAGHGRALTYENGLVTFTLTTTVGRVRDVVDLLGPASDEETGRYARHRALLAPAPADHASVRWIESPGVLVALETNGVDVRALEPAMTDLVEVPASRFAGARYEPYRLRGIDRPDVVSDGPMAPVVDDVVDGWPIQAFTFVGTGDIDGATRVCRTARGSTQCGSPPLGGRVYTVAGSIGPGRGGEAGAWLTVRDDVAGVRVGYLGRRAHLLTPVRPAPGADRVMFVYQPPDRPVTAVDLLDGDGRVLASFDGPVGPWLFRSSP